MKKECCGEEVGHLWDCPTLTAKKKVVHLDGAVVLEVKSYLAHLSDELMGLPNIDIKPLKPLLKVLRNTGKELNKVQNKL